MAERTHFVLTVLVLLLWSHLSVAADYLGVWQPYSFPSSWSGAITIEKGSLSCEAGPSAGLEKVRAGGSVFRLVRPEGDVFDDCGNAAATYIAFRVLDSRMLAVLHYRRDDPPPEPEGSNALEIITNNACSVMFFVH